MIADLGLLFLRVGSGLIMMLSHGWGKLLGFSQSLNSFPDPLGVSSPVSLTLTVGAEFFCAALLVLGIKTKWVAIPLTITMLVAAFVVHSADPWDKKELAVMFALCYGTLAMTGGGKFSIKE